jgi:hypothetical protein
MKKVQITFLLGIFAALLVVGAAAAQTGQLELKMSRDWGYGGFGGEIQGLFSMRVTGPADLARVEFYIDDTKIGELTQAPFNLQFNTDNYPLGTHQMVAVGFSASGQEYRSNVISATFVPEQSVMKFLLPVLGVVLGVVLLSAVVPFLSRRGKRVSLPLGAERKYGAGGGGICPKCHRPFALPLLSANLGISKLAVCPYCGKMSVVRLESIERLRQAEKAELEWVQPEKPAVSEEEKLRQELDDSKYQ